MESSRTPLRSGSRFRVCSALGVFASLLALPVSNAAISFDLDPASPSGGTDVNAFSFSRAFTTSDRHSFSVDRVAIGLPGTAVGSEAAPGVEEAHGDIFHGGSGTNVAGIDEESLGLVPGFFGDDLDALGWGRITSDNYFSIDFLSGSNGFGIDSLANDIFINSLTSAFASGELDIGLDPADNIDALHLHDTGVVGGLDSGLDSAVFSLGPFSPSVLSGAVSASDLLFTDFDGTFGLWMSAADLGLDPADNLNALTIPEPGSLFLLLLAGTSLLRRSRSRA